jgi:hypothetical protein
MFKGLNIVNFAGKFSTDEKCYEYIASIKWKIDIHVLSVAIRSILQARSLGDAVAVNATVMNHLLPILCSISLNSP